MKLTKHEIIDEVANFYNLKNRSVNDSGRCLYNGPDGKHCAFARMCHSPESLPEGTSATGLMRQLKTSMLKQQYKGHKVSFYQDIQSLHDEKTYWTETGLSEKGKIKVDELKEKYKS